MPPVIDDSLCELCGICFDVCPQDILSFEGDEVPTVSYPDECWHCGACVLDCPVEAVRLRLPLQLHIVPSPANYGPPAEYDADALAKAADFSRSVAAKR
jgi:adenylylsulfate reductase subunit B